jgi:hypothetical protein
MLCTCIVLEPDNPDKKRHPRGMFLFYSQAKGKALIPAFRRNSKLQFGEVAAATGGAERLL